LHYLTLEDVAEINERFVGPDGLADIGLLESAVLRPQTSAFGQDAYGTIHDKAGAFFHSLALDTAQGLIDAPTIAKRLESWVAPAELPDL
jgi:prophage maintenance system killer protein